MLQKASYLVSIFIGAPTEQHARIRDIASQASGGEYAFVHLHQMGAFVVLNTSRTARQLSQAFSTAMAPDDRLLICELGQDCMAERLSKASTWLSANLVTRPQTVATRHGNPFPDL
jgi:hypothetical protein